MKFILITLFLFLETVSERVRIIYAGGVTRDSCQYAACDDIDGFLLGAASLRFLTNEQAHFFCIQVRARSDAGLREPVRLFLSASSADLGKKNCVTRRCTNRTILMKFKAEQRM